MPSQLHELDGVTVSTTELSITNNTTYSAGSNQTSDNAVQLWLDTTNMAKGDEFEIRFYEKVEDSGGTARLIQV